LKEKEAMDRCLIVFDLDTKSLEQHYHNASWRNGYADIQRVLSRHRFLNIQGTVYLSEVGVRQAHGTLALQELAIRFPWFEKCVSNVRFYDLADDFNAQFIVDGVAQAREAFERRIQVLRQQLVSAGLPDEKVNEIIDGQQFSLEDLSRNQPALPPPG
jgi:virulence-associated protein VapD